MRPDRENASRVYYALQAYGAPTAGLTPVDFAEPGLTFQIGVPPIRIDVLSSIDGIEFEAAWPNKVGARYGDQDVFVISRSDLVTNKRAAGRLQDLADVEALESIDPEPT